MKKLYPGLDILKFICAIAIVCAHTEGLNDYNIAMSLVGPLLVSAVPLFFLISAFLFFRKNLGNNGETIAMGEIV